jgi:hypothetical protein
MQYRWERWLGHLVGFEEMYVLLSVVKERRPASAQQVGTEEAS